MQLKQGRNTSTCTGLAFRVEFRQTVHHMHMYASTKQFRFDSDEGPKVDAIGKIEQCADHIPW